MRTLVVYATKHGATEKIASKIAAGLGGEVKVVNLRDNPRTDPSDFDTVVIGGSIQAGKIQPVVKSFCQKYQSVLLSKKLGLFISCLAQGQDAQDELTMSYPDELLDRASAKDFLGGEVIFGKMGMLERWIMQKITKSKQDLHNIAEDRVAGFVAKLRA